MSNAIAGNENYTKVDNTVVSANAVLNAQQDGGFVEWKQVEGSFTPTAAGNYAVTDVDGNNVTLPGAAVIQSIVVSSDVALVGGTNVRPVLGLTAGAGAGTNLTAVITNANVNASFRPVITTAVVGANTWLSGTTTGVNTAGVVRFRVVYTET